MGRNFSTIDKFSSDKIKNRRKAFNLLRLEKDSSVKFLLVEDSLDFYQKYLSDNIDIYSYEEIKDYIRKNIPSFPNSAKDCVKRLVEKQLSKEKDESARNYGKCYGLIDRDFDFNEYDKKKYKGRLECTDKNDFETTLLFFDFENIESKFMEHFNSNNESFNILKTSIEYASKIGRLRKYREDEKKRGNRISKDLIIDFKEKEKNSDCYYKYLNNGFFSLENYIGIEKINRNDSIINNIFEKYKDNNLLFCRGHDIFDFVACFYKLENKYKYFEKFSTRVGEIKILDLRKECESIMEDFFNRDKFKTTNIYAFFQRIQA